MTESLSIHEVQKRGMTIEAIAKEGYHFVVDPEVFAAVVALVDQCLHGSHDQPTTAYLLRLKGLIETTTIPVRAKQKTEG